MAGEVNNLSSHGDFTNTTIKEVLELSPSHEKCSQLRDILYGKLPLPAFGFKSHKNQVWHHANTTMPESSCGREGTACAPHMSRILKVRSL